MGFHWPVLSSALVWRWVLVACCGVMGLVAVGAMWEIATTIRQRES